MDERKFEVLYNGIVLATDMTMDIAICLIKGYADTWYNQKLDLQIREITEPKVHCEG